jgi:chromosome segregation ATPase
MRETTSEQQNAVVVLEDYSVIVAEKEALQAFFADGRNLDELYGQVETMARGLVADVSTKEGISQVKTAARQLASVRTKVDDIGKKVVADLKALPKVIDENRRAFREKMEALQDDIRRPVTEIENREDEIEGIAETHVRLGADATAEAIERELECVKAIPLTKERWKESLGRAEKAVAGEIYALELMKAGAEKREQEARELEELRKKQAEADRIIREQKIREEAERRAREEAEARAAAEKARLEREKAEAERKAADAERAAQEAREREEAAMNSKAAIERAAIAAQQAVPMQGTQPQPKPSKWTPEMKAVNNAIVKAIAGIIEDKLQGFTPSGYDLAAREIVKAIVNGKISNLKVEY